MNYIDLIILLILAGSTFRGFKNGFISELASLVGLILGVWGAIKFAGFTRELMVDRWGWNFEHIGIVAFIATLIAIVIGISLLAKVIQKMVEAANLSIANRVLGAFLSLFKTAFFLGVLLLVFEQINERFSLIPGKDIQTSRIAKPLHQVALNTFPFLQGIFFDQEDDQEPTNTGRKVI